MDILMKAQRTPYKHARFFKEGDKSVYYVMKYMLLNGFTLTLKNSINGIDDARKFGYEGTSYYKTDIAKELAEKGIWKPLCLFLPGRDGGSDSGKLKVLTFVELMKFQEEEKMTI